MKILITGGYGNISWWCTKLAIDKGNEVFLLNRMQTTSTRRNIPKEATVIKADYRDFPSAKTALADYSFDVVCDFLCQGEENANIAYELFKNKTKQYVLISTESVYKRSEDIMDENSEKYDENEASPYILGKLQSERFLTEKHRTENFPLTIVRPGYTLDTILPYSIGHNCYTVANRYLNGFPILMAGNGNNKWTFTHSSDFAKGLYALLGNNYAIGEAFNIMGDTVVTFNKMMETLAHELVDKEPDLLHIPANDCLKLQQFMPQDLMKQRMQNAIFDTSKIKSAAGEITSKNERDIVKIAIQWLNEDKKRIRINEELNSKLSDLTNKYRTVL